MDDNRGFFWDGGDPSVGIFGGEWQHGTCPEPDEDGLSEFVVHELELAVVRVDELTVRTYWLLTCSDCAQQVIVSETDYAPSQAALDAEQAAEAEAQAAERVAAELYPTGR